MANENETLREVLEQLSEALEKARSGDAVAGARAAAEALTAAGTAIEEMADRRVGGGLLKDLGTASRLTANALAAVEEAGYSESSKSLGTLFGLADVLSYNGSILATAAASLSCGSLPDEHQAKARDLHASLDDVAFAVTVAALDLTTAAGGIPPVPITYGRSMKAPCRCNGAAKGVPVEEALAPERGRYPLEVPELDLDAVRLVVEEISRLLSRQAAVLSEMFTVIISLLAFIRCANQCPTCNVVVAGPAAAAGGLTVAPGAAVNWVATQVINWTVCCCDWCWIFWWDHWAVAKTTSITWTTRVPNTRPAGAALRAAGVGLAARVAAAPPPAPLCP